MKASRITSTAALALLLGLVAPAWAGQERPADKQDHPKQENTHQQAKPTQEHEQQQQAKPDQQHEQQRPAARQHEQQQPTTGQGRRADRSPSHVQQQQQRATVSRQEEHTRQQRSASPAQNRPAQQHVQQSAWQEHRAQNWQSDHRTWQQRGGYKGYRIPDNRFRGSFGSEHGFRIEGLPFMEVGGYPRFQYGGYWLSVVDPWPANWGDDWYDNDQVYIVYTDGGYYLYNQSYPGVGIAVSISM